MFNMSEASKAFLEKYFPAFFEYADLDRALIALDDFIVLEGMDRNDNITVFGQKAQAIYDEIFDMN